MVRGFAASLSMNTIRRDQLKKWRGLLLTERPDPTQRAGRIVAMEPVTPRTIFLFVFIAVKTFHPAIQTTGIRSRP